MTTDPTEQPEVPTEQAEPPAQVTFAELGVRPETVQALADDGIQTAFPIQAQTIPLAMGGADLIGQAKTGTGKTLAFGVAILERIDAPDEGEPHKKPQALVVAPTRELAVQVSKDLEEAGRHRNVRVLTIYGGRKYEPQIEALQRGVDIVVGTPGRLIDLVQQRHLQLDEVRILVLDEADEMLDMGFLPDVEKLVDKVPDKRQTMLFSATMPGRIVALARRYMVQPTHVRAADAQDESATVDAIEQHVWRAHPMDKMEVLARVLQADDRGLTMVFSRTKRKAQKIVDDLTDRGFAAAAVHGDLGQGAREQALRAFRAGKVDVLVATEVAARGIDVEGVTHVVNYECPDDEKAYVHRIGRTGRAGESGTAITLVDWEDINRWQMIDRALKLPFADPIETYSTSDHIYDGLSIPRDVKGYLPRSAQTRSGLDSEELEDLGDVNRGQNSRGQKSSRDGDRNRSGGGRDRNRNRSRNNDGGNRGSRGGNNDGGGRSSRSGNNAGGRSDGSKNQDPRSTETEKQGGNRRRRRRTRGGGSSEGKPETAGSSSQ